MTIGIEATSIADRGRNNRARGHVPRPILPIDYAPALFEKLDTASASVLYTSKTVSSFVICSTS